MQKLSLFLILSTLSFSSFSQDLDAEAEKNQTQIKKQLNNELEWRGVPFLPGVKKTILSPFLSGMSLDADALKQAKENKKQDSPQEFDPKNLPEELQTNGWHVLFEVKYAPTSWDDTENGGVRTKKPIYDYYINSVKNLLTANSLEGKDIPSNLTNYDEWLQNLDHKIYSEGFVNGQEFRSAMSFVTLQSAYQVSTQKGQEAFRNLSEQMNDDDYLNFLSGLASWAPYNDDRALFKQTDEAGKGIVTTRDQLTETKFGVCGDIHSMVAKGAELKGWEAVTLGYALPGGEQHVITAIVKDPKSKNPDVNIVNYGRITTNKLADTKHNPLTSSGSMHEMGTQIRMFKNDMGAGLEGEMVQIGQIPTALGNFFRDLVVKDYQAKDKAFNGDQNFRQSKVTAENVSEKNKTKNNGDTKNKKVTNGISIYEGAVDGAYIWGLAVNNDVFKEIKKPDGDLRRLGYHGASLATSLVDLNRDDPGTDPLKELYVYLNIRGGRIYNLKESQFIKLQGLIGYELDGFAAFNRDTGAFETGDGSFQTFLQLLGDYHKKGTHITFASRLDLMAGLRNQNLMNDLGADFTKFNINPLMVNAWSNELHLKQDLNKNLKLTVDAKYSLAHFGNRITLSTGILFKEKSKVELGYNGGFTNLRLPGTNTKTNFMMNQGTVPDGLFLGYSGDYRFKRMNVKVGATGSYNFYTQTPGVNVKASFTFNLPKPRPKKPLF